MSFVFYVALTCAVAIAAEVAVDWFSYTIPIWIHILCGVSSLLGYLAMYKTKNNNAINFFIALFLPLELKILLLALSCDHYVQTAKWYLLIIVVIISLSLVIGHIMDRRHKRPLRPFSYIHDAQVLCCLILINFVAQAGFAAASKINDAMYFQATYEQQMEQQQVQLEQQEVKLPAVSLENHLDTFCVLLDTDRWSRMTETDKITVLNFVLQEEASYLGLPFELTLEYQAQIQNYEFGHHTISTYAFYSGQEHKVCISAAAIDDPIHAELRIAAFRHLDRRVGNAAHFCQLGERQRPIIQQFIHPGNCIHYHTFFFPIF